MSFFNYSLKLSGKLGLAMLSMILMSAPSIASVAYSGMLFNVHFMYDGAVLVYTTGTRTGVIPSCGAAQPQRYAFNSTTPAGKSQLAGILAAQATQQPVIIVGTGDCGVYGDSETIGYFYIAQ